MEGNRGRRGLGRQEPRRRTGRLGVVLVVAALLALVAAPASANPTWALVKSQAVPYSFFVIATSLLVEYPCFRLASRAGIRRGLLCLVAANLASALAGLLLLLTCQGGAVGGHPVLALAEAAFLGSKGIESAARSLLVALFVLGLSVAIESAVVVAILKLEKGEGRGACIAWILVANLAGYVVPAVLRPLALIVGRSWGPA